MSDPGDVTRKLRRKEPSLSPRRSPLRLLSPQPDSNVSRPIRRSVSEAKSLGDRIYPPQAVDASSRSTSKSGWKRWFRWSTAPKNAPDSKRLDLPSESFDRGQPRRDLRRFDTNELRDRRRSARPQPPISKLEAQPPTVLPLHEALQSRDGQRGRRSRSVDAAGVTLRNRASQLASGRTTQLPLERKTTAASRPRSANPSERGRDRRPRQRPSAPRSRGVAIALYAARMAILSIGVGVLAGTILSVWDPASHPLGAAPDAVKSASSAPAEQGATPAELKLAQEVSPLKAPVQALAQKHKDVVPGVFIYDVDNSSYLDINGTVSFAAASTIKVPVLVAFFQDVDAGKVRLDEKLTMRPDLIGKGSGDMQFQPPGTQFTALETVIKMITISDNTATNMVIARLGGSAALNQRFQSWGLATTKINNLLPDLEGTNTTSAKDMVQLMARISQGELVSLRSRDRLLDIMRKTVNNSLLPQGLGEGATIAHKTGDIGTAIGDVGLVDAPNGRRYAVAVMVKCPFNDARAYDLIQQVSRLAYQHFIRPAPAAAPNPPQAMEASETDAQLRQTTPEEVSPNDDETLRAANP